MADTEELTKKHNKYLTLFAPEVHSNSQMFTLHLKLMGDRVLAVHILYGARVLAGIVSGNFAH